MSNKKETTTNGGVGFFGLLTILFIGLKLTGHITWSWWWVLSPLWIPAAIVFAIFIGAIIYYTLEKK
jgi:predicted tellurium resistance membrane protein TerC